MSSPLRPLPAFAAAACSAVLFVLAYPGMDFWPLAFVALTPLYVAIDGQSLRARLGAMAGVPGR